MPFVRIQLKEGRTPRQKAELAQAIIDEMDRTGFAKPETVRVIFEDMAAENYYAGQARTEDVKQ